MEIVAPTGLTNLTGPSHPSAPPDWESSLDEAAEPDTSALVWHFVQICVKRAVDVVLASVMLLLLLPIALAIALAVKLTSRGPLLFRQQRVGRGGRPFRVLKFRTMWTDAEAWLRKDAELHREYLENNFKLPGFDPRLTPVGRRLRKMSLDELPQLFNVVRGQMSLVGPRPVLPEELLCYGDLQAAYLAVRPGLTGPWQVSGRSRVGYPDRALIDYEYVVNWNLLVDAKILLKTVPALVSAQGAC